MAMGDFGGWLKNWANGDNPQAGSQSTDSNGINGNWWKIWQAFLVLLNIPSLTIKSGIIGAAQLAAGVVDGVTMLLNGDNKLAVNLNMFYTETEVDDITEGIISALNAHKTSGDEHDYRYYGKSTVDSKDQAVVDLLNTHKASGDHDARYPSVSSFNSHVSNFDTHKTSGDHDARYVKLDGTNQSIDGTKDFTSGLNAKSGIPMVRLKGADDSILGLIAASAQYARRYMSLWISESSGQVAAITIVSEDIGNPTNNPGSVQVDRDVYAKGSKLATEEYVQTRVRSGSSYMTGQTDFLNNGSSGNTKIGSNTQVLAIPTGMRITKLSAAAIESDNDVLEYSSACNVQAGLVKLHVANSSGIPTFSIQDRNGGTIFSFAGTVPVNTGAAYTITITVSI